jgi:hypothetical protein
MGVVLENHPDTTIITGRVVSGPARVSGQHSHIELDELVGNGSWSEHPQIRK